MLHKPILGIGCFSKLFFLVYNCASSKFMIDNQIYSLASILTETYLKNKGKNV